MSIKKSYWQKSRERNNKIKADFDHAGVSSAARMQVGGGFLVGGSVLLNRRVARGRFKTSKLGLGVKAGGVGLAVYGAVKGYQAYNRLKSEGAQGSYSPTLGAVVNPILGLYVGAVAGIGGILAANKLGKAMKAARAARNMATASKLKNIRIKAPQAQAEVMTTGKTIWRRIRGRIVPIKIKDVGTMR